MGAGAHNHRHNLIGASDDVLPTREALALAKQSALAAVVADLANLPWPPGPAAHALLDQTPLLALAVLEANCGAVGLPRLARCLGLDPVEGPDRLAELRAGGAWPALAFRAAMAVMGGSA